MLVTAKSPLQLQHRSFELLLKGLYSSQNENASMLRVFLRIILVYVCVCVSVCLPREHRSLLTPEDSFRSPNRSCALPSGGVGLLQE